MIGFGLHCTIMCESRAWETLFNSCRRAKHSGDGFRTAASPVKFLPRGDEELLGSAIILIDGDHAGLEDSQGSDVGREDTEGARE